MSISSNGHLLASSDEKNIVEGSQLTKEAIEKNISNHILNIPIAL